MRYFTPERWMLLQDVSDEQHFDTAHREWQQALTQYREHLAQLRAVLPAPLRRFSEQECLHDAILLTAWQVRSRVQLVVRPEPSAEKSLLLLTYTVIETPQVTVDVLPPEYAREQMVWMYDEIGLAEKGRQSEKGPTYEHSILLGSGWELTIRFSRFHYSRLQALLPIVNRGSLLPGISPLSQTA